MTTREKEPYSVEELRQLVGEGWEAKYVFFCSHKSTGRGIGRECLSQWYPASFVVGGILFRTAEHFMMYRKAQLFGDDHVADLVLETDHPGEAKALGRSVRDFDHDVWEEHRFDIVVAGSIAKFEQNSDLRSFLVNTAPHVLVEASPKDRIWGIGLAEKDRDARRPNRWRGLNLLGFALMKARAQLAT